MLARPLSPLGLLADIESGRTSAAAILRACGDTIAEAEPIVGAFEHLDLDGAIARSHDAAGPLRGLAVGVKDVFDTADMPTSYGTQIYAGHHPVSDAAVVSMVRRAGGVVLGKTVTTELAFFEPGRTRNPANPGHTPGGSSSGSAAAVAAGMVPFAIGSQTGGSVIRPAAYCGIAGYKPSFRILPTVGLKAFAWSLDTVGLFAPTVADVAFFAAAITGRSLEVTAKETAAPRIAVVRTHLWHEATGEMRAAIDTVERLATAAGASVVSVDLPGIFSEAFAAHQVIQDHQAAMALAYEMDNHRDLLSPLLRDTLDYGRSISVEDYDTARRTVRHARLALRDALGDADVIVTPSATGAAPEGLASTGSSIFNRLWTLMGVPAVNVPGLHAASGLPLGIQVVGHHGRDGKTLAVAHWLEGVLKAKG